MKILIVKTSSLGDILQCFPVLDALHRKFPGASIDWVVEAKISPIVEAHPLVSRVISIPLQDMKKRLFSRLSWKALQNLRKGKYDLIFDFQGNCKSGLVTMLSRGVLKIGFSRSCVREWPNILATKIRFAIPKHLNMRAQYLSLIQQYFREDTQELIEEEEILHKNSPQVMVCPGSKWVNKQLKEEAWVELLCRIQKKYQARFLLIWGSLEEKALCERIQKQCEGSQVLPTQMSVPAWRDLMREMDLVIAVDSSALHLCGTTSTPSFSIFGPTSSEIFKPMEKRHFAFQGKCPYEQKFLKQCPILRSCPTGACIREISPSALFLSFDHWWSNSLSIVDSDIS